MIIFSNLDGTLKEVVPSNITQGSNKVDSIYLVVPSASLFTSVNSYFILPEGTKLGPYLMSDPVAVHVDNDTTLLAYEYVLDSGVTNFPGTVDVSFNLMSGEEIIGTIEAAFEVLKSTLPVLPDAPTVDVYSLIISAYNNLKGRVSVLEETVNKVPGSIDSKINAHNTDLTSHQNIQDKIKGDYEGFSQNLVDTHNASEAAHPYLRDAISRAQSKADEADGKANTNAENIATNTANIATNSQSIVSINNNVRDLTYRLNSVSNVANSASDNATTARREAQAAQDTADEALQLARNAPKNKSFQTYNEFKAYLNTIPKDSISIGISIYILEKDVPDVWVSDLYSSSEQYNGTKEDFIRDIAAGNVRFGHVVVSGIEADTPDISNMMTTDTDQEVTGVKNFTKAPQINGQNIMSVQDKYIEDIHTGTLTKSDALYVYNGDIPAPLTNVNQVSKESVLIMNIDKAVLNAALDTAVVKIRTYDFYKMAGNAEVAVTIGDLKPYIASVGDTITMAIRVNRGLGNKFYFYNNAQPQIKVMTGPDAESAIQSGKLYTSQLILTSSKSFGAYELKAGHLYRYNSALSNKVEDLTSIPSLDEEDMTTNLYATDWTAVTEIPFLLDYNGSYVPEVSNVDIDEAPIVVRGYFKDLMNTTNYPGSAFKIEYYSAGTTNKINLTKAEDQMVTDGNGRKYRAASALVGEKIYFRVRIYEDAIAFCFKRTGTATADESLGIRINQLYCPGYRVEAHDMYRNKKPIKSINIANTSLITAKNAGILKRYSPSNYAGNNIVYFYALHKPTKDIDIVWTWYADFTVHYADRSSMPTYNLFDIGLDNFESTITSGGEGSANIAPIELRGQAIGTDIDTIYFNTKLTTKEVAEFFNYEFDTSLTSLEISNGGHAAVYFSWGYDATVGTFFLMYGAGTRITAKGLWSERAGTINRGSIGSITFTGGWNSNYVNTTTGALNLAKAFDNTDVTGYTVRAGRYFDVMVAGSEFTDDYSRIVADSVQFAALDTVTMREKEISTWVKAESKYQELGYEYVGSINYNNGDVPTRNYIPDVVPVDIADIMSGNFAPFAITTSNGINIYAKKQPTNNPKFNVVLNLTHLN